MKDPSHAVDHIPKSPLAVLVIAWATFAAQTAAYEQHVDCGRSTGVYVAHDGTVYQPDQAYSPGSWGHVGGEAIVSDLWAPYQLVGTPDPTLYLTARKGASAYRFSVPAGDYLVTLRLAEIEKHGWDLRRFEIALEGAVIATDLDLWRLVEKDHALDIRVALGVTDGELLVSFDASVDEPLIAAIDVVSRAPDSEAPAPPAGLTALGSYGRVLLSWAPPPDDDVARYRLYRSELPEGPFTLHEEVPHLVHHYYDDDVGPGEVRYYQLRAVDAFGNEGTPSAVVNATVADIGDALLPVYEITLDPDSLYVLNSDPYSDDYVHGVLAHDGTAFEDTGIRYRGSSSRRFNKKGYKTRFPPGMLLDGRDRLNLVASYAEPTMLTNVVGFWVFSRSSVPTPLAAHSLVTLNGEYRGVFTEIEQVDERFLDRIGLDEESNLYRANHNLSLLSSPAEYALRYEKITNPESGYDDLIDFIEVINLVSDEEFPAAIAQRLYIDEYLDYYATEILLANDDFTHRDYFLYHDQASGKWMVFPWDLDSIMWDPNYHIATGTEEHPDYSGYNVLIDRMMAVPIFRYAFGQKLIHAMDSYYSAVSMAAIIGDAYADVETDAFRDPFKRDHLNNATYATWPQRLQSFVADRIAYLQSAVYDYMPEIPGLVQINEFMAANDATLPDEFGEYDDWIELYNGGDATIDLAGMYLSDDLGQSTKWRLPDVVLGPGQYLLVWADGDTAQGPLHAGFKLSASGEEIGLFDRTENGNILIDSIAFGSQIVDVSQGRYPDGSNAWESMPLPTPGAANVSGGTLPPEIEWVAQDPLEPGQSDTVWVTTKVRFDTTLAGVTLDWRAGDGGFAQLPMADDGLHHDGLPADGVYGSGIGPEPEGSDVTYYVEALDIAGGRSLAPPGAPDVTFGYTVGYVRPEIRLNELLASNTHTNPDEAGDYDDWIELHHMGTAALNLGGFFLTDDLDIPDRWALPDTAIAPGEFLLVWADGEPGEGPLHAGFKLSAQGEEVALIDFRPVVPVLIDSVSFGPQTTDVSLGRLPDGTGEWVPISPPTPGQPNDTQVMAVSPDAVRYHPLGRILRVHPTPTSDHATFALPGLVAPGSHLVIYDATGRTVDVVRVSAAGGADEESRGDWAIRDRRGARVAPGIYFVRLETPGTSPGPAARIVVMR